MRAAKKRQRSSVTLPVFELYGLLLFIETWLLCCPRFGEHLISWG